MGADVTAGAAPAEDWLPRAAERFGDVDAITWEGGCWTWSELARRVASTVRWLEHVGVGPGDVVAVLAENGPAWARWLHAAATRGATLLPLNARLTAEELVFQLEDAGVSVCCVGAGIEVSLVEAVRGRLPELGLHRFDASGEPPRERSAGDAGHAVEAATSDPDRALAVLYTSGTTGRPKGVRLPARAFASSALASQRLVPLGTGDRWLVCMPLFHVGGLSILVRCALAGATAVVQRGFDAAAAARVLERGGVTHVSFVPTMLERVLHVRGDAPAPESLRCVLLGGGGAAPKLIERAWALGYPVVPTYGLTEACSQVATRDSLDRELPMTGRLHVLDGLEVVVRDEAGHAHQRDAEGEICVRGPSVTSGYIGHAAERAAVDGAGWLATGDVGRLDGEGRLEVLDRREDLIVTGGENVYPAEVERVLLAHAGVAEVAVVGRADASFGARPVAFWVQEPGAPAPGADELAATARASLAGYKVPVQFISAEALPRTASGKIQRGRLREVAASASTAANGGRDASRTRS